MSLKGLERNYYREQHLLDEEKMSTEPEDPWKGLYQGAADVINELLGQNLRYKVALEEVLGYVSRYQCSSCEHVKVLVEEVLKK